MLTFILRMKRFIPADRRTFCFLFQFQPRQLIVLLLDNLNSLSSPVLRYEGAFEHDSKRFGSSRDVNRERFLSEVR